ncbi:hypothetical protein [Rhodoplanes sp. Z2-YC6860]|uniref:hypothetical protein n=1 Tax=Rhodoplanes sp. Z2-YC6860 TaxID=674703 RepID=UPI000835CC2D|nr:hypothetical protein [Rhodoplanes sp. Z2-YC6860]
MGDGVRRLLLAAVLISITPALAADLPLKPEPAPAQTPAQSPDGASPLAPPSAACREWSDGCRTCVRAADGAVSCSNIGIACTTKPATCTASDTPAR